MKHLYIELSQIIFRTEMDVDTKSNNIQFILIPLKMLCLAFRSDEITPISSFILPWCAVMWNSFCSMCFIKCNLTL